MKRYDDDNPMHPGDVLVESWIKDREQLFEMAEFTGITME